MKCIIGKKLGMTTLHDEIRGALNVTLIDCAENVVSLVRSVARDGYAAVQIETKKTAKKNFRKEFRFDAASDIAAGAVMSIDQFVIGDLVNVTGVTKAKGFQGVVKRHGFKGSPTTHGRKHDLRKAGSIGATDPQHVFKGKRMAGRMGGDNCTVQNLQVVLVDADKGLIGVRGAVPGVVGRMLCVKCK
jgi:large subunit ribosomal protein L3